GVADAAQTEVNSLMSGSFDPVKRATLLALSGLLVGNLQVAELAVRDLEASISTRPDERDKLMGTSSFLQARIAERRGRLDEARNNYVRAAAQSPNIREAATVRAATIDIDRGSIDTAHRALLAILAPPQVAPSPQVAALLARTYLAQ